MANHSSIPNTLHLQNWSPPLDLFINLRHPQTLLHSSQIVICRAGNASGSRCFLAPNRKGRLQRTLAGKKSSETFYLAAGRSSLVSYKTDLSLAILRRFLSCRKGSSSVKQVAIRHGAASATGLGGSNETAFRLQSGSCENDAEQRDMPFRRRMASKNLVS